VSRASSAQRARLLEAISDDLKKCSTFLRPKVSRAALDAATRLGVDLRSMNWRDQPRFDPQRTTFHIEHMVQASAIRAVCLNASSNVAVLAILKEHLCVAWILKSEDRELTQRGYRVSRVDSATAYRESNIELVHPRSHGDLTGDIGRR
jgi:hypothetical protein